MTTIELIVAVITVISLYYTLCKIARKETKWYWNFAPFGLGATTILWIARIFG